MLQDISIIIPAKNEEAGLSVLLPRLKQLFPKAEIIVVNDCSSDKTAEVCCSHGVKVITHQYSIGNGAAIKTGARAAAGNILAFMDADGQHDPDILPALLSKLEEGYEMVVGARDGESQANLGRWTANAIYNRLASWMVGQRIPDLTSGFRVAKAKQFRKFLYLLPNGFSYPTTITMSFFRAGYPVSYVPIKAAKRLGKSHVRHLRDGVRFLLIIFKVGTLYAPFKFFLPISISFFAAGLLNYLYTFIEHQRFTNMSALLLITSVLVFLIGLISEQISALTYKDSER